jgi:hypothetical protein
MPLLLMFLDQLSVIENPRYRLDEWYKSSKIRPKFCNVDDLEEDIQLSLFWKAAPITAFNNDINNDEEIICTRCLPGYY